MKNAFKIIFSFISAFLAVNPLISALVALSIMDVISGLLKAWKSKSLSSQVSREGMTKKAMIFIVVGVAWILDTKLGMKAATSIDMCAMVTGFYCITEVISIFENAKAIGIPIPKALIDRIPSPEKEMK